MDVLDRKARIALAEGAGMKSQEDFERVVDEAATLRAHKVIEHGEQRYTSGEEMMNLALTLMQLRKKGQRLDTVLNRIVNEGIKAMEEKSLDSLRDTMLDGMNYNAMGVQLLDQLFPPIKLTPYDPAPETLPTPFLRFEQVAIQVRNIDSTIRMLKILGLNEWSEDHVIAHGYMNDDKVRNRAHLAFNYQAGPFELELINYTEGSNWLEHHHHQYAGLSHIGIHVGSMKVAVDLLRNHIPGEVKILQEVQTREHTNPKIPAHRRYWYVILGTRGRLGFDLKLIQRLDVHNYTDYPVMISAG